MFKCHINRESSAATDVTGGQPGASSKFKVCVSNEESNIQVVCVSVCMCICESERERKTQPPKLLTTVFTVQVVTEMSQEENKFTSTQQPFPLNYSAIFPYNPPPRKLLHHWGNVTHLNILIYKIPPSDFVSLTIIHKYFAFCLFSSDAMITNKTSCLLRCFGSICWIQRFSGGRGPRRTLCGPYHAMQLHKWLMAIWASVCLWSCNTCHNK